MFSDPALRMVVKGGMAATGCLLLQYHFLFRENNKLRPMPQLEADKREKIKEIATRMGVQNVDRVAMHDSLRWYEDGSSGIGEGKFPHRIAIASDKGYELSAATELAHIKLHNKEKKVVYYLGTSALFGLARFRAFPALLAAIVLSGRFIDRLHEREALRLACEHLSPEQIEEGIAALAKKEAFPPRRPAIVDQADLRFGHYWYDFKGRHPLLAKELIYTGNAYLQALNTAASMRPSKEERVSMASEFLLLKK